MEWTITVHGHTLRIFLDSERVQRSADLSGRRGRVEACLHLLPLEHIRLIVEPIIVVDRFPGGRVTGGGWFPPQPVDNPATRRDESDVTGSTSLSWLGEAAVRRTGVPASEILTRIGGRAGTGIVGITSAAFLLDENWGHGHQAHEFTMLHEVGHSVDFHSSLIPPANLEGRGGNARYQGQKYPDGGVGELAAEAYSRFFLRPTSMCRGGNGTPPCLGPGGVAALGPCPTQRRCSGRLQRDLQSTAAFHLTSVVFPLARADSTDLAPSERIASAAAERRGPLNGASATAAGNVSSKVGWRLPGSMGSRDV